MAKRKVTFSRGCYYHVYNRGSNRQLIFRERENYLFLLKRFGKHALEMSITVVAYCLMPNHYHFLLRQDGDVSISDLMQAIFNSYSKAFNKMYKRSGTLFEGPFKSIHVDKENYLIHLCRYIHRNPLEAGLVNNLEVWPFSNYLEWVGGRDGKLVDRDFLNAYFRTAEDYIEFVKDLDDAERVKPKIKKYLFEE